MSRLIREQEAIMHVVREIEQMHESVGIKANTNLALSGSGSMVMHGIDRDKVVGDIDLFAPTEPWFNILNDFGKDYHWLTYTPKDGDLARRFDPAFLYRIMPFNLPRTKDQTGVDTISVQIFSGWRRRSWGNIDVLDLYANCVKIEGILCVGMEWLLDWKRSVERPKDLPDIILIEEYLERQ